MSGVVLTEDLEAAWFAAEERHAESWRNGLISWDEQRRRRLRDFLPLIDVSPGNAEDLDQLFREGYLPAYEEAWTGYADVSPTVAELAERGFALGILTNGAEEQQRAKLRRIGLLDRVGPVCTAEGIGVAKPHAQAFHIVCSELGVPPHDVVYVGDDYELDVVAARAAGLHAIHLDRSGSVVTGETNSVTTLRQLPTSIETTEYSPNHP
jgi:putative hydrolase of the HAD superfamily